MSVLDGLIKEAVSEVLNGQPLKTRVWMVAYGDDKRMREVFGADTDLCARLGIR